MKEKIKEWIAHMKEFEIPIFVLELKKYLGLIQ